MPADPTMTKLEEIIHDEITKSGFIPFARFMELALYCPQLGYYEQNQDNVGRQGDFFTSVSVGPLFGELLAFQFDRWFQEQCEANFNQHCQLIEAGTHDGKLAVDILRWLRQFRSQLFSRLEYVIIEPSARRRQWQRETLLEFLPQVRWVSSIEELSQIPQGDSRILFSNELLDAFPVRRLGWDAPSQRWFEWAVTVESDRLAWRKIPAEYNSGHAELEAVLPDGYTIEISPAAEAWYREAATQLGRGRLVSIDYGFSGEERFRPERVDGTLRAYRRHQASRDLLAYPGQQDLTSHVDFSAIQQAGESAGWRTESFQTQAQFITGIFRRTIEESNGAGSKLQLWPPDRVRQFQTLTHPGQLGQVFRVLVQARV